MEKVLTLFYRCNIYLVGKGSSYLNIGARQLMPTAPPSVSVVMPIRRGNPEFLEKSCQTSY